MASTTTIQTIRWDIAVPDIAQALTWQDKVSRFTHTRLPGIIEDTFGSTASNIVIETIEIDVENISNEQELEERFITVWNSQVKKQLALTPQHQFATGPDGYGQDIAKARTYAAPTLLAQLEYYLLHACLAWNADRNLFDDDRALVEKLLALPAETLIDFFARLRGNSNALLRFIYLVKQPGLQQLVEYMAAATAPQVKLFADAVNHLAAAAALPQQQGGILLTAAMVYQYLFTALAEKNIAPAEQMLLHWWQYNLQAGLLPLAWQQRAIAYVQNLAHLYKRDYDNTGPKAASPAEALLLQWHALPGFKQAGGAIMQHAPGAQKPAPAKPTSNTAYFIDNAGIVLLYPYLRALFTGQGLLQQNAFTTQAVAMQAARLLQCIACGSANFKEYHLVLNKVLCGMDIDDAIEPAEDESVFDAGTATNFLQQVITNWPKLKNTSPDGFRSSFLLRGGKLVQEAANWLLYVEKKPWDMLMEHLPYPVSIIKLPWMQKPIYTEW